MFKGIWSRGPSYWANCVFSVIYDVHLLFQPFIVSEIQEIEEKIGIKSIIVPQCKCSSVLYARICCNVKHTKILTKRINSSLQLLPSSFQHRPHWPNSKYLAPDPVICTFFRTQVAIYTLSYWGKPISLSPDPHAEHYIILEN